MERYDSWNELLRTDEPPPTCEVGDRVQVGLVKKTGDNGWRRTERVEVMVTAAWHRPEGDTYHGHPISSTYFDVDAIGTFEFYAVHVLAHHAKDEAAIA